MSYIFSHKNFLASCVVHFSLLQDHHDSYLEMSREQELYKKALIIQRVMLAHKERFVPHCHNVLFMQLYSYFKLSHSSSTYREAFVKKRRAALVLQKNWRGHRDRKDFCKVSFAGTSHVCMKQPYQCSDIMKHCFFFPCQLKQGFARLQAKVRSRQLHAEYKRRRVAAITLQTQTRGYLARKDLKCKKNAVILLQTQTRGLLARKTLKRMKSDVSLQWNGTDHLLVGLFCRVFFALYTPPVKSLEYLRFN